jgi:hypothetical protein
MIEFNERRFQRAPCSFPGAVSWHGNSSQVKVISLSIGGAYFACSTQPPAGGELSFAIRMSDQCLIQGRGRVIWNSVHNRAFRRGKLRLPAGFGIEFDQLTQEDHEVIDSFVRRKLRILRGIAYELRHTPRNVSRIKSLFSEIHPDESQHLNHIRKVVSEELRYFRIRK